MIEQHLKQMADECQWEEGVIVKKSDNTFLIGFEGGTLELLEHSDHIEIACSFEQLPEQELEKFLTEALRANFLGYGTYGAVLGIHFDAKKLKLKKTAFKPITYQTFRDCLEDMMNSIDFWTQETRSYIG